MKKIEVPMLLLMLFLFPNCSGAHVQGDANNGFASAFATRDAFEDGGSVYLSSQQENAASDHFENQRPRGAKVLRMSFFPTIACKIFKHGACTYQVVSRRCVYPACLLSQAIQNQVLVHWGNECLEADQQPPNIIAGEVRITDNGNPMSVAYTLTDEAADTIEGAALAPLAQAPEVHVAILCYGSEGPVSRRAQQFNETMAPRHLAGTLEKNYFERILCPTGPLNLFECCPKNELARLTLMTDGGHNFAVDQMSVSQRGGRLQWTEPPQTIYAEGARQKQQTVTHMLRLPLSAAPIKSDEPFDLERVVEWRLNGALGEVQQWRCSYQGTVAPH